MKRFNEKQTGVLSSSDLKTRKGKTVYWTFFAILLLVSFASVVPAVWTVLTAFKDTREIYSSFGFFPKDMSFGKMTARISELAVWNIIYQYNNYVAWKFGNAYCCMRFWRLCFVKA